MNTSVNPSTPFHDGYDPEAESAALADLLQAEQPDESDPRWPRVIEYSERLRQLRQMQTAYALRKGADAVMADTEASVQAGGLIDDEPDAMVFHTKEAHRLFMGQARDPQGNIQPIVGGKRVAGIFGELPKPVFTGAVAPRHSRRRVNLSEQELSLLQKVAEGALDGELIGGADAVGGEGALL